ncbi:MAG: tRNA (adenosine(37)-N6)-threonylcarbamoyltransferase complex dimerization subunit type 1 TsaB [Rhodoglobus sp.]
MLLAIDTSAGTSVAIVDRDAGVIAEHSSDDTRGHAEVIGIFIQRALADSGVEVAALSGVAIGMGPGPFTGLRVGIAAARAFAFGAGKPVVSVVSHDAIAFGVDGPLLVVTDARRREFYWSAYSGADAAGLPVRVQGPGLSKPEDLPQLHGYRRLDAATVSAGRLGMLAETMFANGRAFAGDDALYLRSPDVTLSSGPKRVTG